MITLSMMIFFLILFTLVVVHEAGHFIFAKVSKMRVDEFAFGFPPKLFSFKRGETKYSFNLIPLGGFVKIFGENNLDANDISKEQKEKDIKDKHRSFDSKSGSLRIFVLLGGVIFNLLATIIFFTFSYVIGGDVALSTEEAKSTPLSDRSIVVANVSEDSNLYKQGLRKGDQIVYVQSGDVSLGQDFLYAQSITELSSKNQNNLINIRFISKENGETKEVAAIPQGGIVEGKKVLGVALVDIAYQKLSLIYAVEKAISDTYNYTILIFTELAKLIYNSIFSDAKVQDALAGPVGLVSSTRDIAGKDWATIFTFAGLLSLSLAVFNILPIPALDGGRILFVLLEYPSKWIFKKKIPKTTEQIIHSLGFIFLIGLMIYVTYFDIIKLVN